LAAAARLDASPFNHQGRLLRQDAHARPEHQKQDERNDQEEHESDFRDGSSCASDPCEPQGASDEGNQQRTNGKLEHCSSPLALLQSVIHP
jgi:hypothetical protein